jgi:hypothetical protein
MAIKRTITTTLPTSLPDGEEIYYQDPNGNLTLWVGHEDGSAWPSVGYKELKLLISINQAITISEVLCNQLGAFTVDATATTSSTLNFGTGVLTRNFSNVIALGADEETTALPTYMQISNGESQMILQLLNEDMAPKLKAETLIGLPFMISYLQYP